MPYNVINPNQGGYMTKRNNQLKTFIKSNQSLSIDERIMVKASSNFMPDNHLPRHSKHIKQSIDNQYKTTGISKCFWY